MKLPPLAVVVNFCTAESRFLTDCLKEARHFARQILVPVCDHFFDGTPENRPLLEAIYGAFPQCQFIEYPFVPERIPKKVWREGDPLHFWHSLSRLIAARHLSDSVSEVLFLDADEIPDGRRFAEWLECSDHRAHTVLKMANYWYFREACYQAEKWEDSVVLVQRRSLAPQLLLKKEERDAIYDFLPGPKRRMVVGIDGQPMFHHYSWVRTEEEMLQKVKSWGHRQDRNWEPLVREEFSKPFGGTDFVHRYTYKKVEPAFDIRLTPPAFAPAGAPNVTRLEEDEVLAIVESGKKSWWKTVHSLFSREKDLDF